MNDAPLVIGRFLTAIILGAVTMFALNNSEQQDTALEVKLTSTDYVIEITPVEQEQTYSGIWNIGFSPTENDIECLALNIYHEARGEPQIGQYAVAEVVLSRMMHASYPSTICGVVKDGVYAKWDKERRMPKKDRCSFHWYCDRKSDFTDDESAYQLAVYIAEDILTNPNYQLVTNFATHYHTVLIRPNWSKKKVRDVIIGNHVFYL